ncbi:hypothetical protein V6N13_051326 [Hibiscus sabdariffa]
MVRSRWGCYGVLKGSKLAGYGTDDLSMEESFWVSILKWLGSLGNGGKSIRRTGYRDRTTVSRLKMITCMDYEVTWAATVGGGTCKRGSWIAGRCHKHSLTTMIGCYYGLVKHWEYGWPVKPFTEVGSGILIVQMIGFRQQGLVIGPQRGGPLGLTKTDMGLGCGKGSTMMGGIITDDGLIIILKWGLDHLSGTKRMEIIHGGPTCRKGLVRSAGLHGNLSRPEGFEGPFQFGDWLRFDMEKPVTQRRRQGIVFKDGRNQVVMGNREHSAETRSLEDGKVQNRQDKGKVVISGGSRYRGAKRTLQGKNEVSHPLTVKRSKQGSMHVGLEEDEVSEATSPMKHLPTVEAAGQPRREPRNS